MYCMLGRPPSRVLPRLAWSSVSTPTPTSTTELFRFDNSYVRDLPGLYVEWQAAAAPAPRLLVANDELAVELGLDPARLRTADGIAALTGNAIPAGATPIAMVYAGH